MDLKKTGYGVAFDVGTTTIVGALVCLSSGERLGTRSLPNPQHRWGRDLIARVRASVEDPVALSNQRQAVCSAMDDIIRGLEAPGDILKITAAGNSVMEHILLGVSVENFSKVPYKPAFKEARRLRGFDIGIESAPEAELYTFPLIGGFIGGDTVAVMLSLGLGEAEERSETVLAIDIGTNSEIILKHGDKLFAASAAAGPAFEGGEIASGMTAARGAISGVKIDGDKVALQVIGGGAAKGICGSGLISSVSAFLKAGVIDVSGRIKDPGEIPDNLSTKVREGDNGNSILLYRGPSATVEITQADIRSLQTAKSAIRAGINILMERASISPDDIDAVYVAGAFGSNIPAEGLKAIGILDEKLYGKTREPLGDAALEGAVIALLSDGAKEEASKLASGAKYVSLSGTPGFQDEFIKNMDFSP